MDIRLLSLTIYFSMLLPFYGLSQPPAEGIELLNRSIQSPVLKFNKVNPVLRLGLVNREMSSGKSVVSIELDFSGTDQLKDIDSIKIFYLGNIGLTVWSDRFKVFGSGKPGKSKIVIQGHAPLTLDSSFYLVSITLADDANIHRKVAVRCVQVKDDQNTVIKAVPSQAPRQRIGIALRKHNDDSVHTYRIPGLTTTKNGSLIAVYDNRRLSSRDLQGDIDIGMSRSTDGGKNWEPMHKVIDMKKWGGLPEKFNGVSDASVLADPNTGKIFIAGLWMHGVINNEGVWVEGLTEKSNDWNHQWRTKGSQPGFGVRETSQFLIVRSTDDGKTWSEPVNITKMCKKEAWWLWAPAPGHGITMDNGTLVFPTQGRDSNGLSFSNITYSKDGGNTWQTSEPAYSGTTENMVVELAEGGIMLNARYRMNRVVTTTNDLGKTWQEHSSSRSALIEPTCMGSLHKHVYREKGKDKTILLFSNPNTQVGRHHMTLKLSFDDGKTWPEKYWMLLDEGYGRGYSCVTSIDHETIGILYEGSGADMIFESIPIKELLQKR